MERKTIILLKAAPSLIDKKDKILSSLKHWNVCIFEDLPKALTFYKANQFEISIWISSSIKDCFKLSVENKGLFKGKKSTILLISPQVIPYGISNKLYKSGLQNIIYPPYTDEFLKKRILFLSETLLKNNFFMKYLQYNFDYLTHLMRLSKITNASDFLDNFTKMIFSEYNGFFYLVKYNKKEDSYKDIYIGKTNIINVDSKFMYYNDLLKQWERYKKTHFQLWKILTRPTWKEINAFDDFKQDVACPLISNNSYSIIGGAMFLRKIEKYNQKFIQNLITYTKSAVLKVI